MTSNPWKEVLDTTYEIGGRAEFPNKDTEGSLDPEVNLIDQTEFSLDQVDQAAKTLQEMDLATVSNLRSNEEDTARYALTLTGDGYDFAHDRQQEKRNVRSNQSVAYLTVVLAFVGMAQATALTANVSQAVTGTVSMIVTTAAGLILLTVYAQLLKAGLFEADELL